MALHPDFPQLKILEKPHMPPWIVLQFVILGLALTGWLAPPMVHAAVSSDERVEVTFRCVGTYGEAIQSFERYSH